MHRGWLEWLLLTVELVNVSGRLNLSCFFFIIFIQVDRFPDLVATCRVAEFYLLTAFSRPVQQFLCLVPN